MDQTLEQVSPKVAKAMRWSKYYTNVLLSNAGRFKSLRQSQLTEKVIREELVNRLRAGSRRASLYKLVRVLRTWFTYGFEAKFPLGPNVSLTKLCLDNKIPLAPPVKAQMHRYKKVAFQEVGLAEAKALISPMANGKYSEIVTEVLAWVQAKKSQKAYLVKPPTPESKDKKPLEGMRAALNKAIKLGAYEDYRVSYNRSQGLLIVYNKKEFKGL